MKTKWPCGILGTLARRASEGEALESPETTVSRGPPSLARRASVSRNGRPSLARRASVFRHRSSSSRFAGGLVGLLACACAPALLASDLVTVTLSSGARITASLIHRDDRIVVLNLGQKVVTFEAQRVVALQSTGAVEAKPRQDHGFFSVGRLIEAPISQLVKRYGDAVVVVKTPSGLGSGFVISPQGHLITNYHVIERSSNISVTLFQRGDEGYQRRQIERVKIIAIQPLRDLALLQIDKEELQGLDIEHVVIAQQHKVRVGDMVFAIGNPLGLERSVTQGIVSSTTRTLGHLRFIQTDASINPGNSGGPLFNAR